MGYYFKQHDGYGRYGTRMIRALLNLGVDVVPILRLQLHGPGWLVRQMGIDFSSLTITCMPPYYLASLPGRQWVLSMCEGTKLVDGWAQKVNTMSERLIVPCEHNAEAFRSSGVHVPIHVIPGGTDPAEFPKLPDLHSNGHFREKPYTFLALADRGSRKGWTEVWSAFFKAFGSAKETPDVRLIVKARPLMNDMFDRIANTPQKDPRIGFWREDVSDMSTVYGFVDVFAIPSRSEGWGMPQREAAMMGIPVITTRYSGLDDGHLDEWAIPIEKYTMEKVPSIVDAVAGEWARPDVDEVAGKMRWCYDNQKEAAQIGHKAADWLRKNQTWEHSARQLLDLIEEIG